MTDEPRPEGQDQTPADTGTAVAAPAEEGSKKLHQTVETRDVGPCKKHIKVTIDRSDIEGRLKELFGKRVGESAIAGFRPGKAPRRLVEKLYAREVNEQVKTELLLASLEQLGEDNNIAPLSSPNIDPGAIEIPKEGPLVYEFEVEVRPEFDLPNYRGLKLKRPLKEFSGADVGEAERRLMAPYSQVVPKEGGSVEVGDVITADLTTRDGDRVLGTIKEGSFRVEKQLSFKDGLARKFSEQVQGARAGDSRAVDLELSSLAAGEMGGKTVQATFDIKDVKTLRMPDMTPEFLTAVAGVDTREKLHELILAALRRNLEHTQRRAFRMQVIGMLTEKATWDLPEDLLMRQARRALSRRIMEMKGDGVSDEEIAKQRRLMEQDILQATELSLKEHFVLQKIAELEKIDVDDDDMEDEITRIANQTDESPRKVRARLEKEDMLEALAAEMIERKALDLILDAAEYEDTPMEPQDQSVAVSTVEAQAVPGQMKEMTAVEQPAPVEQPQS